MGEIVALFNKYFKSFRSDDVFYEEVLYMCREIVSEFEFFMCLIVEIVTRKNL